MRKKDGQDQADTLSRAKLCFQCGACSGVCPVKKTTKVFDPRRIVHALALDETKKNFSDVLWYCSQCGSCELVCPMDVKPKQVIKQLQELSLAQGKIDEARLFELGLWAKVEAEKCILCLTCIRACPYQAIEITDDGARVKISECVGCGVCVKVCPVQAILIGQRPEMQVG